MHRKPIARRQRRHAIVGLSALAFVATIIPDLGAAALSPSAEPDLLHLTIAQRSPIAHLVDVYIAQADGIFEEHGLEVDIEYANPPTSLLVSGRADLVNTTSLYGAMLALDDFEISHIMMVTEGVGLPLIGSPDVSSIADLQALGDDCVLATFDPGSNATAFLNHYVDRLDLECRSDQVSSIEVAVSGTISRRYHATVLALDLAERMEAQGANILIDPRDIDYQDEFGLPGPFLSTDFFGSPHVLEDKRPAVVRFIRAVLAASERRQGLTTDEIASAMQTADAVYRSTDADDIAQQLEAALPANNPGPITQEIWQRSLEVWELYGVENYDSSSEVISYSNAVDSTFYDEATHPD